MIQKLFLTILILLITNEFSYSQFHNYSFKFGIQSHLVQPSSEFDNDAYRLSLLGRGFLRTELNSVLEAELGTGIGELNGKDFENDNWGTTIWPTDLRILFSPLSSDAASPYIYSGIELLRWKVFDFPKSESPNDTKKSGWNISIPIGGGIEIEIANNTLLDISGGYTFALEDNLNYYNSPEIDDGYFHLGFGMTFVMGTDDKDEDQDGISKADELIIGTDPNLFDSDGDNFSDGEEIQTYYTNPLKKDTDNDGLDDYEEIMVYKTDPNSQDTDGDNLSDFSEIRVLESNPISKDSDGDKISDDYEVNIYKTNPSNYDTDGDKLSDFEEINTYKTDPNKIDTDLDNFTDGEEVLKYNTDPLVKDAFKINPIGDSKKTEKILSEPEILRGVNFETDKAEILPESEVLLNQTLELLKNNPQLNIEIRGYTDNVGNANYNKILSLQRAERVKLWLVQNGIDALRLKAVGFGELNPIADNSTENGRKLNRRIEIIKLTK